MDKKQRKIFHHGIKQLNKRRNWCFWPKGQCSEAAIRAHSVQNARILELLCHNGHVVMPQRKFDRETRLNIEFRPVGRNVATTFTGLCAKHDRELFSIIENDSIKLTDDQHLFLLAYRAVLKEAHDSTKAMVDTHMTYSKGIELGEWPSEVPSDFGIHDLRMKILAYQTSLVRNCFDKAYRNSAWDAVDHRVFYCQSRPAVAVNSMFTTDFCSNVTDDAPAYTMLNIFPEDSRTTAVVFSFLSEDRTQAEIAFGDIWSQKERYDQQYQLSKLILKNAGNFVISPVFYEGFEEKKIKTILRYFIKNLGEQSYDLEDPDLFLFWPIS